MESVVQKALRDIKRAYSVGIEQPVKYEFVLADSLYRQFVAVLQALFDVVGSKSCELAGHFDILPAETQYIGIGPQDDSEIPVESAYARYIHKLDQTFSHADRTASGTAAAVRCRKGLVEVEMHDI